jgi:hypothetical protein
MLATVLFAAVASAQSPPAAPKTYSGHGAGSVSPDIIAKYAPRSLPPDLSKAIQSMLDVRAPGLGVPSSDGKRLFFTWRVTGTSQVWRLDGPQRFPVQLTGGDETTAVAAVAPDDSFLVISRDRNGEEYPGLYLQSPDGGPLKVIQHQPRVQTFLEFVSDDSRYIYYRANDIKPDSFAIYRYDRKSGSKERLFDQPGLWSVADHRPDGHLLLNKDLGSSVNEVYEWEPASKKLTPIVARVNARSSAPITAPPATRCWC